MSNHYANLTLGNILSFSTVGGGNAPSWMQTANTIERRRRADNTVRVNLHAACRLSQSFPYGSSRSSDNDRDQDQSVLVDIPIVNSKAEVRFHVQTADWISAEVRTELLQRYKTRVNKAGELVVTSEVSRSQHKNLAECVQKIRHMISEASYMPPEPSEEDLALRAKRLEKRDQERLKQKKLLSALKKSRRMDFD
ncbi:peptidyl-tRNA hydrolase ICT1, mitochondrial isoform X2 [Sardina pilchardus]|uniref:peptidyl-tRNA hydrolase ICT1, mitochondrial isoform X2 n=1 Tax=Sardina pilchardus TaxID=27697 RepID=UPI002E11A628